MNLFIPISVGTIAFLVATVFNIQYHHRHYHSLFPPLIIIIDKYAPIAPIWDSAIAKRPAFKM